MRLVNLFQSLHSISSRCTADSAPAVDSASAEIEVINGCLVVRPARDRSHEQELIEHELTVVEIAFGETVDFFKVERCDDVMRDA